MTGREIRVALVAQDRRFLRVTSFLLARAGYAVESVPTQRRLLDLAESVGVDVVVVDGSESLTATARIAAAIRDLDRPVGLVIVADEPLADPLRSLATIPKWHSFERLCTEIEQAYQQAAAPAAPRGSF